MKKVILTTMAMACAVGAFAQGTVTFNNRFGTATTHVYWMPPGSAPTRGNAANDSPAGGTVYAGGILIGTAGAPVNAAASTTFAALLGATGNDADPLTFQQANGLTTFRTGAGAGNLAQVTSTFNNILGDAAAASIQMAAWDNSSGLYSTWALAKVAWGNNLIAAGLSAPFNLANIGGQVNTPPNLTGLQSFSIQIIPEPSTMALAGLGVATLMIFRRRK